VTLIICAIGVLSQVVRWSWAPLPSARRVEASGPGLDLRHKCGFNSPPLLARKAGGTALFSIATTID